MRWYLSVRLVCERTADCQREHFTAKQQSHSVLRHVRGTQTSLNSPYALSSDYLIITSENLQIHQEFSPVDNCLIFCRLSGG